MLEGEERPTPDFSTGRISLRSISVVNSHITSLENARLTVTGQMEALVLSGLETLASDSRIAGTQLLIRRHRIAQPSPLPCRLHITFVYCLSLSKVLLLVYQSLSMNVSDMHSIPSGYPERWSGKVHIQQISPIRL